MVYYEEKVLIALNFQPLIPRLMVLPHVDSILFMCDQTLEEFLSKDEEGRECFKFYTETL